VAAPERKIEAKIHEQKDVAVTWNQARLRMRTLVGPMCDELEQAADAIIAGTTNRAVQLAALHWKIEGVPVLRQALFQPDPFTAIGDTWVLLDQMADYFQTGHGKQSLGAASAQAAATCRHMEEEFAQVAATMTISGDVSRTRAFARKWATEHPIAHSIAGRESILSRVVEREVAEAFSFGEAATELTTTLDDLNRKLEVYSAQLLRQTRWETELFKLQLLEGLSTNQAIPLAVRAAESAEQAVAAIERLAPAVERVAGATEGLSKVADSERETATLALDADLNRTIQVIHEERLAALKQLQEALADERKALAQDVDQITRKALDRAMLQLALIVAVTVAVLLLAAVASLFLVRRMFFPSTATSNTAGS
jgi:hypothetical protein